MTAGSSRSSRTEEDDPFTHGCFCCELHVEKEAIIVGIIYFIVELYAVWNHFSDGNPTFPLCFFGVTGILVFGIWKKNRTALLVFLILLTGILIVEFTMCFLELPELIDDIRNEPKAGPVNNVTTTEGPSNEQVITFAALKFAHLALRVAIGAYLFKVLLTLRRYIAEIPPPPPPSTQPVVTAIRLEDYTAVRLEDAPPAYTSTD